MNSIFSDKKLNFQISKKFEPEGWESRFLSYDGRPSQISHPSFDSRVFFFYIPLQREDGRPTRIVHVRV